MLERLLSFSLKFRFLILIFTGLIIAAGIYSVRELPIDAVPDITSVQVQVITRTAPMGPVEVERYVTFPVETAMNGIQGVEEIRSLSRFGLSVVTVVFKDNMNLYFARQQIGERLVLAKENIPRVLAHPKWDLLDRPRRGLSVRNARQRLLADGTANASRLADRLSPALGAGRGRSQSPLEDLPSSIKSLSIQKNSLATAAHQRGFRGVGKKQLDCRRRLHRARRRGLHNPRRRHGSNPDEISAGSLSKLGTARRSQ